MKKPYKPYLPLNLQMFAESEPGGDKPTFEVNGQQMTGDQLAEAYKKLQADHTKISQRNSEMSKEAETVKPWLEFDKYLDELSSKTGQDVKPQVGRMIDSFVSGLTEGKAPTQTQMANLVKEIDKAEKKGDDATVKQLESLQAIVMENEFEKNLSSIEQIAKDDEIPFDRKEFLTFADEWLEDMGIGENDDFDMKLLRKAYQAYEAMKLKEQSKKPNIPQLGTSGGASSPEKGKENKVGGLRGAAQKAMQILSK